MKTLYKLLAKFGRFLVRRFGEQGYDFSVALDPKLVASAKFITAVVEQDIPNASSENKHARAFARLRRIAPKQSKQDVATAIEIALRS